MTVIDVSQKVDFLVEITRFFHKLNQEWRRLNFVNVEILNVKKNR